MSADAGPGSGASSFQPDQFHMDGIPPELRNFVSSAQDILSQLHIVEASDLFSFTMFIDYPKNSEHSIFDAAAFEYAVSVFEKFLKFIESEAAGYLWFVGPPQFLLKVPSEYANTAEHVHDIHGAYISGTLRYGDSVDDEWFLVSLLLRFSELEPTVAVSCVDSDGQFMLIEAANSLPSWMTPETCASSVWIRAGKVQVVRGRGSSSRRGGGHDDDSHSEEAFLSLEDALSVLRSTGTDSPEASKVVHSAVSARTLLAFPALAVASRHNVVVCLPATAAALFVEHPQSVADIVRIFSTPQGNDKEVGFKVSALHPSFLNLDTSKIVQESSSGAFKCETGSNLSVCVRLQLSRLLYSKLMFRPFETPDLLADFKQSTKSALLASHQGSSARFKKTVNHTLEVSCRLLWGLQMLLSAKKNNRKRGACPCRSVPLHRLRKTVGAASTSLAASSLSEGKVCVCSSPSVVSTELPPISHFEASAKDTDYGLLFAQVESDLSETRFVGRSVMDTDSDAWLHLTPEELDKEMQVRCEAAKSPVEDVNADINTGFSSPTSKGGDIGVGGSSSVLVEAEADKMHNIVNGMKGMFAETADIGKFDIDSCSDSEMESHSEDEGSVENSAEEEEAKGKEEGDLNLDYDKILSLMEDDDDDDMVPHQARQDSHTRTTAAKTRTGTWFLPSHALQATSAGPEECLSVDSDDESFDEDAYNEAMDAELTSSVVGDTFERDVHGQVDIDQNLLQNMLESHASQGGAPGPASQLMAKLNIQSPAEPHLEGRESVGDAEE